MELPNDPEQLEEEAETSDATWSRREAARSRQIAIGKNRPEYRRYLTEVTKENRSSSQPQTPNPRDRVSKRQFDRALSDWRRRLHEWDLQSPSKPAGGSGTPPSSTPLGGSTPEGKFGASPVNRKRPVLKLQLAQRLELPTPSTVTPGSCTASASPPAMWGAMPCEMDPSAMVWSTSPAHSHMQPAPYQMYGCVAGMVPMEELCMVREMEPVRQPDMIARFGGRPAPLEPIVKRGLMDSFETAQNDSGDILGARDSRDVCGVPEESAEAVLEENDEEDSDADDVKPAAASRDEAPRTPRKKVKVLGPRTPGGFPGALRSPPASVSRTPKAWMMDTPSPERVYQGSLRHGGLGGLGGLGDSQGQQHLFGGAQAHNGAAGAAGLFCPVGQFASAQQGLAEVAAPPGGAQTSNGLRVGAPVSARWFNEWHAATVHSIRPDGMIEVMWPIGQEWSVTALPPSDVTPAVLGLPLPGCPLPGMDERGMGYAGSLMAPVQAEVA